MTKKTTLDDSDCCGCPFPRIFPCPRNLMGTTASKSVFVLSQKKQDLKFLGDRFPFGDDELEHLYQAYQDILQLQNNDRTSFLTEWAMYTVEQPSSSVDDEESIEQARKDRSTLLQVVEEQILPLNLGNRLYQAAFLAQGDTSLYQSTTNKQAATTLVDEYTRKARLEQMFEGISNSGRRGAKAAMKVLFDTCCRISNDTHQVIRATELIEIGYRVALATAFLRAADRDDVDMTCFLPHENDDSDQTLAAFANSIVERGRRRRQQQTFLTNTGASTSNDDALLEEGLVEWEDVLEWVDGVAPVFASILPTFIHYLLFPGKKYPPSRTAFDFPRILSDSTFFPSASSPLLFTFASLSTALDGSYYRLYTSTSDGLSFNRLQNALLGYSGPTLLIVRATNGGVFGAFTASPWKESKDFYGNSDCFLFQIAPMTAVYRPTGNARNFMYCNPHSRSRGYDQQCHGLGFGGTVDEPRLFLAESFDNCVAASRDLTFDNGSLLPKNSNGGAAPSKYFELDSLEVWGVGGDDVVNQALGARAKAREIKAEGIRRARKVDKAQFLDDFRSGAISSKAFKHRQEIDGRADADVEDRYRKAYNYEK